MIELDNKDDEKAATILCKVLWESLRETRPRVAVAALESVLGRMLGESDRTEKEIRDIARALVDIAKFCRKQKNIVNN